MMHLDADRTGMHLQTCTGLNSRGRAVPSLDGKRWLAYFDEKFLFHAMGTYERTLSHT